MSLVLAELAGPTTSPTPFRVLVEVSYVYFKSPRKPREIEYQRLHAKGHDQEKKKNVKGIV